MNDQAALDYLRAYFRRLFEARDLSALDDYLAPDYWDDDIGEEGISHIEDSRRYLAELFARHPTIGVDLERAVCHGHVVTAYLAWHHVQDGRRETLRRGVAIFVLRRDKIASRHTFIYEGETPA